jgi:hypothetical protein
LSSFGTCSQEEIIAFERLSKSEEVGVAFLPSARTALSVGGYQRTFPDQWAFVRYATENKLGLDFTTPPKRSDFIAAPR